MMMLTEEVMSHEEGVGSRQVVLFGPWKQVPQATADWKTSEEGQKRLSSGSSHHVQA